MYTLYYAPGTCSLAVHAVINEIGINANFENANGTGSSRTPEFLKLSPRGTVPVLVEDNVVIKEGAAQMVYLMDKHQSGLLPKEGIERAKALEWLMFANSTLHPAYGRAFHLSKTMPESPAREELFGKYIEAINKLWNEVDEQLGKTQYVAGDKITAADILLTVIASWGKTFKPAIQYGANVKRLIEEVSKRPAFQQALKQEASEYKAAA